MNRYNILKKFLPVFFLLLLTFLIGSVKSVQAATIGPNDFGDGISNWSSYGSNPSAQVTTMPMAPYSTLGVGYSFGLAANNKGVVPNNGQSASDTDFLKPTVVSGGNNSHFSKMNEFINDNGSYINALFQGSITSNPTEGVSFTSPDFMIAPANSTSTAVTSANFSLLGTTFSGNYNYGLTNKKYYVAKMGTDPQGNARYAYKIVGDFKRTNTSNYDNGTFDLQAEILLRPSPTNAAIVQRELYLHNATSASQNFVILFGEDTNMVNGSSLPDNVDVRDLGNKRGLYIESGYYNGHNYRLYVTNETPDGFTSYSGQLRGGNNNDNWASGFTDGKVTGTGAETSNNDFGALLTPKLGNTIYTLKWNPTNLAPGATSHYSSTFGVVASPMSIPTPTKTYVNESRSDGTNQVNDKLKFTLKMINNGYGAQWNYTKLVDQIPEGLQIDPNSITQSNNGVAAPNPLPSDYDASTRTLTIYPNTSLTDQQYTTITFEANITKDAIDHLDANGNLTNSATFTGIDQKVANSTSHDYPASVDIPVQKPSFYYTFSKQVRNLGKDGTDTSATYEDSTDAKVGDVVQYFIEYKVSSGSKDSLASGSKLSDDFPTGIVPEGGFMIKGPKDDQAYHYGSMNTGINQVDPGETVTVEFKANVTSAAVGAVTNVAKVTGGTSTSGFNPGDMVTNGATVNVQKSNAFTSVPKLIDFGSTNMYGKAKTLENVNTEGELIVTHPDSNPFNVSVSYDNDNTDDQMKNQTTGSTIPTDGSGLLFIKQRTNSASDSGTWKPILASGVPIQTDNFAGNQQALNLSDYVGVGDWQIKLSPNTEVGNYKGTLSWNLVESV
ncbi:cell surface protein precursor [Companilactobacillus mindensis DSM 14500]|uniref:Cell surface protein n=1 Tax=Companilactobacillus mindensis DSM 14500 TaxID=1423770 RepID=A0A0R1QHV6_9LACO|nr:isopeptide-forming domain-containing fimbrial protein [Companilactobacillus mindensis]KRL44078.1 cell surface protein precursor [Companilactobacillus mindensis DSM 14500]GEO79763.1 hypothetical protein LMI01_20940 [Companilactobacillus mindensis]